MDMLEELDDLGLPHELPPERHPHMQRYRIDPITAITNPFLFKQRYRFSTDNVTSEFFLMPINHDQEFILNFLGYSISQNSFP